MALCWALAVPALLRTLFPFRVVSCNNDRELSMTYCVLENERRPSISFSSMAGLESQLNTMISIRECGSCVQLTARNAQSFDPLCSHLLVENIVFPIKSTKEIKLTLQ